jgi:uncharacterized protein (DUF885 family)
MNDIHAVADAVLRIQSTFDPLNATMLGVPGYDHRLADPAVAAEQSLRRCAAALADRAEDLAAAATTTDEATTAAVAAQQARAVLDRVDAGTVEYSITDFSYVGPAARLLDLMPVAPLPDAERAEAYLTRLRAIPGHLDAVIERHRIGGAAGRVPVARLVDAAVDHLDRYLADPGADPLRRALPSLAGGEETLGRVLDRDVRPAFARYRQWLADRARSRGRPDDRPGLCWIPGGDDAYRALMRVHTTTAHTAEHLHRTGLDLLDALRQEFAEAGARTFGTADQAEIFRRLEDPAMRWAGPEELLAGARHAIARAEAAAPRWFGRLPAQRCEVRPVPAELAPGAPAAYYFQPSLDGLRPGIYYANTHRAHERNRFLSEVTAFHEAVPGHHFQLTLALERTDLPLLRRLADINAHIEGWALYSERLADEMGLYRGDMARLGMLAMDSVRAARLVVDTGLHALGWGREHAVEFLTRHTPLSAMEVAAEVDRYIAYPGQALSYMVGRLEIQRVRRQAEQRLGARFDIRAFHDLVLGAAPLPLNVLDRLVSTWDGAGRHAAA